MWANISHALHEKLQTISEKNSSKFNFIAIKIFSIQKAPLQTRWWQVISDAMLRSSPKNSEIKGSLSSQKQTNKNCITSCWNKPGLSTCKASAPPTLLSQQPSNLSHKILSFRPGNVVQVVEHPCVKVALGSNPNTTYGPPEHCQKCSLIRESGVKPWALPGVAPKPK